MTHYIPSRIMGKPSFEDGSPITHRESNISLAILKWMLTISEMKRKFVTAFCH